MRVMITGGGTGGHVFPAVAIIEELRRRDPQLLLQWVGRRHGMEESVSGACGVPFRRLPVEGWPRRNSPRRLWVAAKLALSIAWSAKYLWRFRPQVVIGVGGYVSLPLMWAAQRLGIPTMIHEQNKRLGMANRLLAPRAARIFLSYEDTLGNYPAARARVVGNPVRAGFANPPSLEEARRTLGLDPQIPVILVCGGSQGAHTLNRAMMDAVGSFAANEAQFLWMTGKTDAAAARPVAESAAARVEVFPFIEDMVTACAAADLVVSRAGASSAAELAILGKPAVLIPYPHATDNHQEQNARAFEAEGAAIVLADAACTGAGLTTLIRRLLESPDQLQAMKTAAGRLAKPLSAELIAESVIEIAFSGSGAAKKVGGE
jgi:UDP-N-acetylglucosamine--N-acetylmuramyl-(pentapeptide) pyrophosphoryl-undecaprenol N-acetylglucosamine transferase